MVATTDEIIQHAISLPFEQRAAILAALQESMKTSSTSHDVEEAWSNEIRHRIRQLKNGDVQAVTSDEAWRRIDDETSPDV